MGLATDLLAGDRERVPGAELPYGSGLSHFNSQRCPARAAARKFSL